MTKASRLPDVAPDEGGASPSWERPRNKRGVFVKRDVAAAKAAPIRTAPVKATTTRAVSRKATTRTPSAAKLVARVTRAVENELDEIEATVGRRGVQRSDAEKRARTLASLARTLAELKRLRESQNEAKRDDDDSAAPRDLCELRETLERRLANLVDPPSVGTARDPESR